MLWLIWIAMMLLVPAAAGVQVWFQLRRAPADVPVIPLVIGNAELHPHQVSDSSRGHDQV